MNTIWNDTFAFQSSASAGLPQIDYNVKGCALDKPTQSLLKLVFDHDMFKNAMTSMDLGKFSTLRIAPPPVLIDGT